MYTRLWVAVMAASAATVAAPGARAQIEEHRLIGCPAGQTLQSLTINGRTVQCVPLPDTSAVQGAIDAEAASRAAADAQLQSKDSELDGRITSEAAARAQAIQELRALIGGGGGAGGGTVQVDCGAGGSIANALANGAAHIIVRGTCNEAVLVTRDDVTVEGDPTAGGGVRGTDAEVNTVVVTGHRVTLQRLTVSGGRNGIVGLGAANFNVRNVTVNSVGRNGIVYASGASGTVDGCTVQSNARDGIVVDGANARVVNSTVISNRHGIVFVNGSNGAAGQTDRGAAGGNTVRNNTGTGILISLGSVATVTMNEVTQNGQGTGVFQATASIAGGNVITGNPGGGLVATASRVVVGDPAPSGSTVSTFSGNGSPTQTGGVFAGLGTSMILRDADISSNNGAGLIISLRSQVQMSGTRLQNNASDGIRLVLGSAMLPLSPVNTVTGNAGFGVQCSDPESSVVNLVGPTPPIVALSGNAAGNIASACTQFDANPMPVLPL
jgi:hypothetical protein